jgi:hypothetical protein
LPKCDIHDGQKLHLEVGLAVMLERC